MRIIAGTLKGRKLTVPKGEELRPTSDRVREAVFSVLHSMEDFEEMTVLDLFAGTGAFGIEAISRGAKHAVFVELSASAAKGIEKSLHAFGIEKQGRVCVSDVARALKQPPATLQASAPYGLVFADAPYELIISADLPALLLRSKLIRSGTIFVLESSSRKETKAPPEELGELALEKEKVYGGTKVRFYRCK